MIGKLWTKQMVLATLPARFKHQYFKGSQWIDTEYNWENIYNRLLQCKTCDEANAIIGNGSWTRLDCDECKESYLDKIIVFVIEEGYELRLCQSCIQKYLAVFTEGVTNNASAIDP